MRLVLGLAMSYAVVAAAAPPTKDAKARAAMQLLKAECFACHNQEKKKGGLVLTSRERLLEGGDDGVVAMPGRPEASLLAKVLVKGADPHMPPKKQLTDAQIKIVREWVRTGLDWNEAALSEEDPIVPVRLGSLPASWQPVLAMALSPDGGRLAVGRGGSILLHDNRSTNFPVVAEVEAHREGVQSLVWSGDGRRLASGGFRRVALWKGESLQLEREWTNGLAGRITAMAFSPDGHTLVIADSRPAQSGFIRVLRTEDGKVLHSWRAHEDTLFSLDLSRDGTRLVTAGGDKLIKVWELASRQEVARLEGHTAQVLAVAFNSNAAQVVSGGADKQLKVWDVATRHVTSSLGKHVASITALAWPGDGKAIVGATEAGAVFTYRNLKSHTGRESSESADERKLGETGGMAACLAATPDSTQVFVGSHEGVVQVWKGDGNSFKKLAASPAAEGPPVATRQDRTSRPPSVSFIRDVLPALSKAGCNAGACHAKPEGQNGFRLSVFSYDPKSDYAEIVKEYRGRRVFPAAPEESLLLKKPTSALPHEGGLRFEPGSETYQLLVRWLREGMAYALTNEPVLERITVSPKERRYRKGASQRLLVQAHYSDGRARDVTRLAGFDSNDKEIATVDEHGRMKIGSLTGQGVVVARFMGFVADSQILVPADRVLPKAQYALLPRNNFIDDLADEHFQQLGLLPSELCSDAEFLRRASLDVIGVLPTPDEVREFLRLEDGGLEVAATSRAIPGERLMTPAAATRKLRADLIDRLLARPEYADYWANKWADLLRPNPDRVGVKSVFVFDQWLRESFRRNQPYDQFVREILLAEGSNHRDGPAVIYRDRREPADLTTMFSQIFLGTRFECAKCHHHPNEKWSQDDFYQFAAFFGTVKQKGAGVSPPISGGAETFYFAPGGKGVKHPVTGQAMTPRPPDSPAKPGAEELDPRQALADWLTSRGNPFFARAVVNRLWAGFFGRGLVEPVDDFRISNPCVNTALLDALADDFAQHGYDLKHIMRVMLESRLYQLSSTPNASNVADTRNFSRAYRRRLPAEVLLDAMNAVTGVPDTLAGLPAGSRATQAWTYKIDSQLMDAFNRPNPSSDPPCERDRQMSVVQSLHLMNSKALQAKLSHKTGRARQLADSPESPGEIATELYLVTLSRPPSAEELKLAVAAFAAEKATRQSATEDVLWALLNSAEFIFNH